MEKYLYFNGHSSDEYFCHIEHKPEIPVPEAKYEEYEVPGRNGKLHADLGYYDNITVTYQLYFHGKNPTAEDARTVKKWLAGTPGAHQLSDGYDPSFFYFATAKPGSITNILNKYGRLSVDFDCDPRHFLVSGYQAAALENGQTLLNPLDQVALPYLEITGNGAEGKVVVNGVEFAAMPPADRVLYADCENWDAYVTGGTNANALVGGTWPTLRPGENTISWSGGVTGVTLTPRWWTL
jgi:phage-related protein|nr:MAG TPA: distal tail protein [Caudoviricetes sp.]